MEDENVNNNTFDIQRTIQDDIGQFIHTIFLEKSNSSTDNTFAVDTGVNLAEILNRLGGLLSASNGIAPPPDVYNHLSILTNALKSYLLLLETSQIESAADKIQNDTATWLSSLFGFDNSFSYFHNTQADGLSKVFELALHTKYAKYGTDGFTSLFTRPPVVYVSQRMPDDARQELRQRLRLPQTSICAIPVNVMSGSSYTIDVSSLERTIADDISCGKTPLLLVAYAGTSVVSHVDELSRIREVCTQSGVWVHVEGDSLAALCLSRVPPSVQAAVNADSATLNIRDLLAVPSLPYCTFYQTTNPQAALVAGLVPSLPSEQLTTLPLWSLLQFMGTHDLVGIVQHAITVKQQLSDRLDTISAVKKIEQSSSFCPAILFRYKASPPLVFENVTDISSETIQKRPAIAPKGSISVSPGLCDALNEILIAHVLQSSPRIGIEEVHISLTGVCWKFNPLVTARALNTSRSDVDTFVELLEQCVLDMDASLVMKGEFHQAFEKVADIVTLPYPDDPVVGVFYCVPRYWKTKVLSNLSDSKKQEMNELNERVLDELSEKFPYLSERFSEETGLMAIQLDLVDVDFNLAEFVDDVINLFSSLEDEEKFVESVSDSVLQSIKEAELRLKEEKDEKIFDDISDGMLRSVPLVSNLYNWWSPPADKNIGVTGRSFDLSSGKLELTDKTYKYKMQVHEDDEDRVSQVSSSSHRSSRSRKSDSLAPQKLTMSMRSNDPNQSQESLDIANLADVTGNSTSNGMNGNVSDTAEQSIEEPPAETAVETCEVAVDVVTGGPDVISDGTVDSVEGNGDVPESHV